MFGSSNAGTGNAPGGSAIGGSGSAAKPGGLFGG